MCRFFSLANLQQLLRVCLLFGLLALAVVPASHAAAWSVTTGSGPSDISGGGGGGNGGDVLFNNIGKNGSTSTGGMENTRDFTWTTSRHNSFFNNSTISQCQKRNSFEYNGNRASGKFCSSVPMAIRRVYTGNSRIGGGSGNYATPVIGSQSNRWAWSQVALQNDCNLKGDGDYRDAGSVSSGSSCLVNQNTVERVSPSNAKGWWQLRSGDAPFVHTDLTQGNPIAVLVRIWRECRGTFSSNTAAAEKGKIIKYSNGNTSCKNSPIFERVIPGKDSGLSSADKWWFGHWSGGNYVAGDSSDTSKNQIRNNQDTPSAGAFYKSCNKDYSSAQRARFCGVGGATGKSGILRGAGYYTNGDSSSYFQQACHNGMTNDPANWSEAELEGEISNRRSKSYSTSTRAKFYNDHYVRLTNWANNKDTRWPLGVSGDTSKNYFCNELNEWASVNWYVPGAKGTGNSTATVTINGIPGRIYAVQTVFLDRAENIITQSVTTGTSPAKPATCTPCPGQTNCKEDCIVKPDCHTDPSIVDPINCPPAAPVSSTPITGNPSTSCDNATIVNSPADCTSTSAPTISPQNDNTSGADNGDDVGTDPPYDPEANSMWFPRVLGGQIYNPSDANGGNYDTDHPVKTFTHGGTNWLGQPINDYGLTQHGAGSFDGLRGQGSYLNDGNGGLSGGFTASVFNPTKALGYNHTTDDPAGLRPSQENTKKKLDEQYRKDEWRYIETLGENRMPVGTYLTNNDKDVTIVKKSSRLTAESCANNPPQWAKPGFFGPADFTTATNCVPGDGNLNDGNLGNNWKVKQAYYLPKTNDGGAATPYTRDVSTNFSQAKDGEASFLLDGHGSDLNGRVTQISIYDARAYGEGTGNPLYVSNSPSTNGFLSFCKATTSHQEVQVDVPAHYQELATLNHANSGGWNGGNDFSNGDFDFTRHPAGAFGGTGNGAIPYESAPAFYTDAKLDPNSATAKTYGDDVKYYMGSVGELYLASAWDKYDNRAHPAAVVYGRSWWVHYTASKKKSNGQANWTVGGSANDTAAHRDAGFAFKQYHLYKWVDDTHKTVTVTENNPSCPQSARAYEYNGDFDTQEQPNGGVAPGSSNVEELPEGQYVIVYTLNMNGYAGGYWGILATLFDNTSMKWVNGFTYKNEPYPLPVYDSRPIG